VTSLQGDLLTSRPAGCAALGFDLDAPTQRIDLGPSSWLEVVRGWLLGGDDLFAQLEATVPWGQRRRRMWDKVVDEPRLTFWSGGDRAFSHPALPELRAQLDRRYGVEFGAVGLNFYRNGADSVASHRDQELRELDETLVAIVTCGARRPFLIRPRGGGRSIDLRPGSGDLLVMGGACQRDWEHGVPKAAAVGPRISLSLRWARPTPPSVADEAPLGT
jgi:alkylated DNA repair dioxygenase AlkB